MIFKIDDNIFAQNNPPQIAELLSVIIKHNHYIDCATPRVNEKIIWTINAHGSTYDKELLLLYRRFSIDDYHRNLLTTVDANDFSYAQLEILAGKEAVLLPENTFEWMVYKHIIKSYIHNPNVSEVAKTLEEAIDKKLFIAKQIGGNGQVRAQVAHLAATEYDGATMPLKCCVIIDRDVPSDYDASGNWNMPPRLESTFVFLSGKRSSAIVQRDIYSVEQPIFHWHMWYKRAIENYFPDRAFLNIGCNWKSTVTVLDRDYQLIDRTTMAHYDKHDIGHLTEVMGWRDYNSNLKQFPHNGIMYTELELLLFKLCKII